MRDENKIEYFKDLIKGIDTDIISLIKERLSVSEELSEYILKNNLEKNQEFKKLMSNNFDYLDDEEIYKLFIEINRINNKNFEKAQRKYNSRYAYIGNECPTLLEFLFSEINSDKINQFNISDEELSNILGRNNFRGYFVGYNSSTSIIPYLDNVTDQVSEIGEINLVQKHKNRNYGFNTEYYGLIKLIKKYNINIDGKNVVILERDHKNKSIDYTLQKLNAKSIEHINIEEFDSSKKYNQKILINTLNFENNDVFKKCSLDNFPQVECVIDLCVRQFYSRLVIEAKDRGVDFYNGYYKELYKHKKSLEILLRRKFNEDYFVDIFSDYIHDNLNIVLVGMPGAGKTTIGRKLAKSLGRKHIDLDREFYYEYGIPSQDYLRKYDEKSFREKERAVVEKIGNMRGVVISTSGGVVSKIENYYDLKKNSIIFMIERELSYLSTKNRPLSEGGIDTLIKMKENRQENYSYFTDYTFENKGDFDKVAAQIESKFYEQDILEL